MKHPRILSATGRTLIVLLFLFGQCAEEEFGRQLLVVTHVYAGEKVMTPTVAGEVVDFGSPVVAHGFVWSEEEDPDLSAPNVRDLGGLAAPGVFSLTLTDLTQNTIYFVRAYATNAAGKTSFGKTIQYKTPQQTTPVSAREGGPGTIIIILGPFVFNNITDITVKFGDLVAEIVEGTQDALQVKVPEGPPAATKISITIGNETQFVADDFTILKEPVIESISPGIGGPGSTVTLRGVNFIAIPHYNTVYFDTIAAAVLTASLTELVTTVPAGFEQGATAVSAKSGALTSLLPRAFVISTGPEVTGFEPKTASPGARVLISGRHFSLLLADSKVKFGSVNAAVASVSDSTISVTVPNELTVGSTVQIVVTTNGREFKLDPGLVVKAPAEGFVTVAANITAPTTWAKVAGPGEVDYRVTADVTVSAELTVAPGVIVEFDNARTMTVSGANSALIAKGTASDPIVFTGKEKIKGSWKRISFSNSNNVRNELTFVEISYGGDAVTAMFEANSGTSKFRVSNSTFSHSKSAGLALLDGSSLDLFANNAFHDNEHSAMIIPVREIGHVSHDNRFIGGNGRDVLQISASTLNNFEETIISALDDGSPYYFAGNVTVNSGLKVLPGARFTFNLATSLAISGIDAYLQAKGTSTSKIVFTGADRSFKGSWNKIIFSSTTSPRNEFDHVEITHGGSGTSSKYNLELDNSNLKISNTTISNSAGGGMYLDNESSFENSFNLFSDNDDYPIYIAAKHIRGLDSNSAFTGNGSNKVYVIASSLNDADEHVWKALLNGVTYFMAGRIDIYSGVTIEPGAIFTFGTTAGLSVGHNSGCCTAYPNAYLVAKGTASKKIVFTGADQSVKGTWDGLHFGVASNQKNSLDYVEVSYARSINVNIENSRVSVTNSTISNSAGVGLSINDDSNMGVITGNTFTDNNAAPISLPAHQVSKLDGTSTFSGNSPNKVQIYGSIVDIPSTEQVWPAFADGTQYLVTGDILIRSGVSVQAGAVFTFAGSRIQVGHYTSCCTSYPNAYLTARGTPDKKVVFTGTDQTTKGTWGGIFFGATSNQKNELDNVQVSYAGDKAVNLANSRVKISNSTISSSAGIGLNLENDAVLGSFSANSFVDNSGYPISLPAHKVSVLDAASTFTGNTPNKVNIYGSTVNLTPEEQIWPAFTDGTAYAVTGEVVILSGVSIQPGATFTFTTTARLRVGYTSACCSSYPDAYLSAKGTAQKRIVFTGLDQSNKGTWNGLILGGTANLKNELDYVDVSNATDKAVNVLNSKIRVTNTTISNSLGIGFFIDDASTLLGFSNNSFNNNDNYPMSLAVRFVNKLDAASTFTGNLFNFVNIYGSTLDDITNEHVWPAFTDGTKYFVSGTITIRTGLVISPGASFVFATNTGMVVGYTSGCCSSFPNAYIIAKGTSTDPISFTRDATQANNWNGITVGGTSNTKNEIEYISVNYGGNGISILNSFMSIKNSTFANNSVYGINKDANAILNADVKTSNTFTNNTSGDTNF